MACLDLGGLSLHLGQTIVADLSTIEVGLGTIFDTQTPDEWEVGDSGKGTRPSPCSFLPAPAWERDSLPWWMGNCPYPKLGGD